MVGRRCGACGAAYCGAVLCDAVRASRVSPTTPPSMHPPVGLGAPLDLQCSAAGEELCRLGDFQALLQKYCVQCFDAECVETAEATGGAATAGAQAAKRY